MLFRFRGYEKKSVYGWLASDGTVVGNLSETVEEANSYREIAQEHATENCMFVRLVEFYFDRTLAKVEPPPDDEEYMTGGSAIGGGFISFIEDVLKEFKRVFSKQYPANDVKFWVEGNKVYAEYKNVRCWVEHLSNPELNEYSCKLEWNAYVTMIKDWNQEYHDVLIGTYTTGDVAVEEAFIGFIRYQLAEQVIDDFF